MTLDPWLAANLVCPRDRLRLELAGNTLLCAADHEYPVVDGIPVLLVSEREATHASCWVSLDEAAAGRTGDVEPLGEGIDPRVADVIGATCGYLYRHLIGRLPRYPIPELRLPEGDGKLFLEVGCSWGRWCFAAARRGYRAVGIDPSLLAVRAARRVSSQLGIPGSFVVGDARALPFPSETFDVVFSYSVFQHFAKDAVAESLAEIERVLDPAGISLVQMANKYGLRSFYGQARRRFTEPRDFDVRYWGPGELERVFEERIGPSTLSVDGFFSLNAQASDIDLMPARYRAVIRASDALRAASERIGALKQVADSLYVTSRKR